LEYEVVFETDKVIRNFIDNLERGEDQYATSLDKIRLEFYEWNRKLEEKIGFVTEEIKQIREALTNILEALKQGRQIS
ncbi:MAG: hypothetical protein QXG44_02755, partial [Candidatus Jordarchaeaceae archaeon]